MGYLFDGKEYPTLEALEAANKRFRAKESSRLEAKRKKVKEDEKHAAAAKKKRDAENRAKKKREDAVKADQAKRDARAGQKKADEYLSGKRDAELRDKYGDLDIATKRSLAARSARTNTKASTPSPAKPSARPAPAGDIPPSRPATPVSPGAPSPGRGAPAPGTPGDTEGGTEVPAPSGPTDQAFEDQLLENYPQFAWLRNRPEMMDLFRRSVGWTPAKFDLELRKTEWWQTTSESARLWEAKKATDPAEADRLLRQSMGTLADSALRLGADISPEVLADLAENAIRFAWTANETNDALVNHVSFSDAGFGLAAGAKQQVRGMMRDYATRITDEEQHNWARRLLTGEADPESMRAYFVEQAKSAYDPDGGGLAKALDGGHTIRQYAAPYIQDAATELGIAPESIDLTEPKWNRPLAQLDKDGNRVQMSRWDWVRTVRGDDVYGFKNTDNGRKLGADFGQFLLEAFGKTAA